MTKQSTKLCCWILEKLNNIKTLNYNTLPLSCRGQTTLSNIDKICPLAIPNQISLISVHVPSLVKIPWYYTSYRPETKIWACLGQITPSKFDEICPLAIPNQNSTISMHIPSLEKIHWCVLKLSSRNEIQTDGLTNILGLGETSL